MSRNLAALGGEAASIAIARATLPLEWFCDVEPILTDLWLVKRLLPSIGLALVYGHPGSGKTFWILDVGLHVALGWPWGGRRVRQGLVIYVAAEGVAGLRNRVAAFRRHHGITDRIPFAIVPCSIDLQGPDADVNILAETIRAAAIEANARPALIVVDTLSKTFGAGKENSDDMAGYVANCGRIAAEFECCVAPVHHRPKDAESTEPRGHGSLKGGVDTVILIEAGQTKRAEITKQKDGEVGERILFNLKVVELGNDEDLEPVTSCIVELTDQDLTRAADPFAKAVAKLSASTRLVFDQLGELLVASPAEIPASIPDQEINRLKVGKVANFDAWFEKCLSSAGTARGQRGDKEYERARKAFQRAVLSLQNLGVVRVWEGYAWITFAAAGTERGQVRGHEAAGDGEGGHTWAPPVGGTHLVPAVPAGVSKLILAPGETAEDALQDFGSDL